MSNNSSLFDVFVGFALYVVGLPPAWCIANLLIGQYAVTDSGTSSLITFMCLLFLPELLGPFVMFALIALIIAVSYPPLIIFEWWNRPSYDGRTENDP